METLFTTRGNYKPRAALANNRWVRRGRKQEPGSEACVAQPMRGLDEVWRSWHSWQGLPSLALPCQGPTPPHHTTPQVKWRHACHSYPPPTPPLVLLNQPTKYRSFCFPDYVYLELTQGKKTRFWKDSLSTIPNPRPLNVRAFDLAREDLTG